MTSDQPSGSQGHTRRDVLRKAAYVTPAVVAIGLTPSVGLAASGPGPDPAPPPNRPSGGGGNPPVKPPDTPPVRPPSDPPVQPPSNPPAARPPAPPAPPVQTGGDPPAPSFVSGPVLGVAQSSAVPVTSLPNTGAGDGAEATSGSDAPVGALLLGAAAVLAGSAARARKRGTAAGSSEGPPAAGE